MMCTHRNQNTTQRLQWVPILTNISNATVEQMINHTTEKPYRICLTIKHFQLKNKHFVYVSF